MEPKMNLTGGEKVQPMETNSKGGQIRIGASDTICRYFLVPYLEKFHKEFPGAHIKVTNATSIRCVELLESGQVDLIVVNYPQSLPGKYYLWVGKDPVQGCLPRQRVFAELRGK
ncbi:MAG: LysR family transcriptional regulator substrate-binding protein [[Clostridium] scindens]